MKDVRRLSLSALNAAARNKPQLIREHLEALLPHLYEQTIVNAGLIRTVQMGPWQHKVDDGLEARKAAYETMYTLVRNFIISSFYYLHGLSSLIRVSISLTCTRSLTESRRVLLTHQMRLKFYAI